MHMWEIHHSDSGIPPPTALHARVPSPRSRDSLLLEVTTLYPDLFRLFVSLSLKTKFAHWTICSLQGILQLARRPSLGICIRVKRVIAWVGLFKFTDICRW